MWRGRNTGTHPLVTTLISLFHLLKSLPMLHSAGGKRITGRKEEVQAMQWVSWTSVLGPEVNGIWPKYSQVNDVNATDALFEHQVIATGDDFGLVKLFRFPCVKKGEESSVCV